MATKKLTCTADVSISQKYPGNAYNAADRLAFGAGAASGDNYYALLKFSALDLDPDLYEISTAVLTLTKISGALGYNAAFSARAVRITSTWSESTDYDAAPSVTTTGASAAVSVGSGHSGSFALDVTAIVKAWQSGSAQYGVRIEKTTSGGSLLKCIADRTSSSAAYITVTYTERKPEPTTPTVTAPGTVTADSKTFKWTASTDNIFASSKLSYQVQVSLDGGSTWSSSYTSEAGETSLSVNLRTLAGLKSGQYYYNTKLKVRVRAVTPSFNGTVYYSSWGVSSAGTVNYKITPGKPSSIALSKSAAFERTSITITLGRPTGYNAYDSTGAVMNLTYTAGLKDGTKLGSATAACTEETVTLTVTLPYTPTDTADLSTTVSATVKDAEGQTGAASSAKALTIRRKSAPTVPTATAPGTVTSDSVTFKWAASTDRVYASEKLSYQLQVSLDGGSTWGSAIDISAGTTSYTANLRTLTGTKSGQYYYNTKLKFRVRAYTPTVDSTTFYSSWSTSAAGVINYRKTPSIPSALTLSASGVYEGQSLTITLGRPTSYNTYNASGETMKLTYTVKYKDGTTLGTVTSTAAAPTLTITVPNKTSGKANLSTTLTATVKDEHGQTSAATSAVSLTIMRYRKPIVTITTITRTETAATVKIKVTDTGYGGTQSSAQIAQVEQKLASGSWAAVTPSWSSLTASLPVSSLDEATSYSFQVRITATAPSGLTAKVSTAAVSTIPVFMPPAMVFYDSANKSRGIAAKSLRVSKNNWGHTLAEGRAWIEELLMLGNKSAINDGNTGVYLNGSGYMHLQRSSAEGNHPYLGFYVDDATGADGVVRLNSSSKIMEFINAAGYSFDAPLTAMSPIRSGGASYPAVALVDSSGNTVGGIVASVSTRRVYFTAYPDGEDYSERFLLPLPNTGLTDDVNYSILTSKNTVTVTQGGTGITSNPSMLVNLASTAAASVFAASPRPGVTGTLPIANGGTGNTSGLAASATKLATARTIRTNLSSTSTASFNGTANVTPGVTGTLPVANGGTGAASAANALKNLGAVYEAGDSFTANLQTAGYCTGSKKQICFTIPLDKPVVASNVTVASGSGFILRQGGNFTHGSASGSSGYVKPDSYSATIEDGVGIKVIANFTTVTNAVTNSEIGILWNGTVTFS